MTLSKLQNARGFLVPRSRKMIDSPEQALWQAVLLRQVEDAISEVDTVSSFEKVIRIRTARHFLTTPGRDLAMLCSLAGINYDAALASMRKRLTEAHTLPRRQQRAEPIVTAMFRGETQTIAEWGNRFGVHPERIRKRLRMGWTIERALTEPTGKAPRRSVGSAQTRRSLGSS